MSLGTNATHLSADEALMIFKAQDDAEKQFRTWKGPVAVRPVFLHSDERIEGLVFITLVALLVRALLRLRCQQAGLEAVGRSGVGRIRAVGGRGSDLDGRQPMSRQVAVPDGPSGTGHGSTRSAM